jgi:hypothetical protein
MTLDYRSVGFRQWRCLVQQAHARNAARSTEALAVRTDSEACFTTDWRPSDETMALMDGTKRIFY